MKKIYANNLTTLSLGRQGENLARQVVFDIRDLESLYGSGTVEVIHQRPGDAQPYPLAVQRDGTLVTWDVTATDTEMSAATANERYGKCELRYYAGETLAKSQIWRTWVESAMDTPSETAPPEPEQGWVEQVLATGVAAQQAADAAKADADRAAVLAAEVAQNASQVAQNTFYTNEAKEAAVLSASEAAQSAKEAAGSASVASTSETNAKASEVSAKAAQKAATESANAAANSAKLASEDASKAAESASSAQQSATSAAESAAVYESVVSDVTQLKQDKLDKTGTAADSDKLGGQLPEHYATAQSVNQLKNDVAAITPDDTAVNGKPWTSKHIVDTLCQPIEESGNPVQCYPVENYPLGVKVQIEPTQKGSGDPSPDNIRPITGMDTVSVTRCGKNLINKNTAIVGDMVFGVDGTPANYPDVAVNYVKVKPNTLYTIAYEYAATSNIMYCRIAYLNEKREFIVRKTMLESGSGEKKTYSFTTTSETHWLQLGMNNIRHGFNHNYSMSLCEGDTACDYEPYADTTDIALPETVYGGTLDVETGVLTVDRGITIADGTTNKFSAGGTWSLPVRTSPGIIEAYWNNTLIISSHFNGNLFSANKTYEFIFTYPDKMTGLFDTVDELNAYLVEQNDAGTPVKFVYKLATPYTIQLTPQQIAALSGVNTIYTDADGVIVTGAEDPKHTITELKNAIISLGGNV